MDGSDPNVLYLPEAIPVPELNFSGCFSPRDRLGSCDKCSRCFLYCHLRYFYNNLRFFSLHKAAPISLVLRVFSLAFIAARTARMAQFLSFLSQPEILRCSLSLPRVFSALNKVHTKTIRPSHSKCCHC